MSKELRVHFRQLTSRELLQSELEILDETHLSSLLALLVCMIKLAVIIALPFYYARTTPFSILTYCGRYL